MSHNGSSPDLVDREENTHQKSERLQQAPHELRRLLF
jgi:hypothetical protein